LPLRQTTTAGKEEHLVLEPTPTWTANIGWVKPGPVSKSIDQFFRLTPPDVNIIISTTMWSPKVVNAKRFDPASVHNGIEAMVQMVRDLLAYEELDFVAVTGDLVQCALGIEWNTTLRTALEDDTAKPAATAMTAASDALREMSVTRLVVATPVTDVKNRDVRAYLEASGFEVLAIDGYPTQSSRDIHALPLSAPYDKARQVFAAAPDANGIYLPSLTWRATEFADRLEQECGVPVITLYNSLIWRALTAISYPTPILGYGGILERVGH